MVVLRIALAAVVAALGVGARPEPPCCAAEKCFASAKLPPSATPLASAFCQDYLHSTAGTVRKTLTVTPTTTVSSVAATVAVTSTETITSVLQTQCTTTVTTTFPTTAYYVTRGAPSAAKRAAALPLLENVAHAAIAPQLTRDCNPASLPQILRSACRCFLTAATTTVTATAPAVTVTGTASVAAVTLTAVASSVTVSTSCTTTVTSYNYNGGSGITCGIASPSAPTSGTVTCSPAVPTPSTNARLRIEGLQSGEGTIFEGCILSGPRNVTTPSGGTHECDGTNNDANPAPGTTPTDMLDAAAQLDGFGYDGTYESQYQDYFITSISQTSQEGDDYWGITFGGQYTPTGGCQFEISPGTDETVWAFNIFNDNAFLQISPEYQVVYAGTGSVTVQVTDTQSGNNVQGATIQGSGGATSDANGNVQITVPSSPGCYQYKATRSSAFISNAFYLTVLEALPE